VDVVVQVPQKLVILINFSYIIDMKPLNLDNSPCSPISSNCVIWQGPAIPCIKLCTGDTVSDVVFQLATELCTIIEQLNVSNYDLSCFASSACPPADFQALIQYLINQICEAQGVSVTTSTASGCPDCVVTVAPCFIQGTTTTMQLVDYVTMIGNRICSLISEIANIQSQINSLDIRVSVLENTPPPSFTLPSIAISCLLTPGSYTIDVVLDALMNNVNGYCSLLNVTGLPADISTAVLSQCINDTDIALASLVGGGPGQTFQSYYASSWVINSNLNTVADAINNIWIAICDTYTYADSLALSTANTNSVTLDITSNVLTANINDTGWVNLQGFAFYQGGMASSRPQCRRIGNQIFFRGTMYIPLANGTNTGAEPLTATDTYRTINRGLAYVGSGGVIFDINGRLLLNSNGAAAQSVIPTAVLNAGTVLDNQYVHSNPFLTRQLAVENTNGSGIYGTVLLTSYGKLELLTNGTLRITPLNTLEQNSSDGSPMLGTSLLRNITSSFTGRSRVIDWINTLAPRDGSMSINQGPKVDGLLTIGRLYAIVSYNAGDNFTNVGAAANAVGQTFIASGTTPTSWANKSRLVQITDTWLLNEAYANLAPSYLGSQFPSITDTGGNLNAALGTNLGGFAIDLDGLSVFVDRCTTDIKGYATC
jgi:hypothetical protein